MDDLLTSHGYDWQDLRERPIGDQTVGDVLFKPDAFQAYWTLKDSRVEGAWAFNGLLGTAWKITAEDDDTYTVMRHDGQVSQTFRRPPSWVTLVVAQARRTS